jgi:hypothetical protein
MRQQANRVDGKNTEKLPQQLKYQQAWQQS